MEPENHSLEKEQIPTNHYIIVGSMLVFGGVGCLEKLVLFKHGLAKIL